MFCYLLCCIYLSYLWHTNVSLLPCLICIPQKINNYLSNLTHSLGSSHRLSQTSWQKCIVYLNWCICQFSLIQLGSLAHEMVRRINGWRANMCLSQCQRCSSAHTLNHKSVVLWSHHTHSHGPLAWYRWHNTTTLPAPRETNTTQFLRDWHICLLLFPATLIRQRSPNPCFDPEISVVIDRCTHVICQSPLVGTSRTPLVSAPSVAMSSASFLNQCKSRLIERQPLAFFVTRTIVSLTVFGLSPRIHKLGF